MATESGTTVKSDRLYYLDWLRVFSILAVFFFHNARLFNFEDWHVKNAVTGLAPEVFVMFISQWMMPIFFVLAGASVYYALKARTIGAFIKERFLRLIIPYIILGWLIISPIAVYLERLNHGEFSGSFFQFYSSHYFSGIYGLSETGNFAFVPLHMWFLGVLFIFSLVFIPLFREKGMGKSLASRFATLFEKPWAFLIPILLVALSEIFSNFISFGGGWNNLSYVVFFFSGYLIFSNLRIQENVRKYAPIALTLALILQAVQYMVDFGIIQITVSDPLGTMLWWVFRTIRSWLFILAILGFGSRYLNFDNRFLHYANEAVLPFYILHQPVILLIGFFIVQWSIGIAPKYLIVTTISFVVIMAIYELLVRRFNVIRFLFGMKLKKRS